MAIDRKAYTSLTESVMESTEQLEAKKSMSEEVDPIDLILAEGIELYGEEGMTEILADFAETGEISEELAGLLVNEMAVSDALDAQRAGYIHDLSRGGRPRSKKVQAEIDRVGAVHAKQLASRERFDVHPQGNIEGMSLGRQPRKVGDRYTKRSGGLKSPYEYIHGWNRENRLNDAHARAQRDHAAWRAAKRTAAKPRKPRKA
jgi:hypothetical protein